MLRQEDDLHAALGDPLLGSLTFLNEAMTRFPDAISFAPGAPNPKLADELDFARHIDRFVEHLRVEHGLDERAARRRLLEYGPSRGLIGGLVARMLRLDLGIDVPAEAVVVTVGAQEAMLLTARALCRSADDLLAVVNPCFVGIAGAARVLDVGVVAIDETEHGGVDVDRLAEECHAARGRGQRIRALYVAPDFSNPSGSRMDLAARRRLLALARDEDLLLLEDNTYAFTAAPGTELPSLKALDTDRRVVLLGTFSKICLPGARVGFAVADQAVRTADGSRRLLADELATLKSMVTVNTSPIGQAVIAGMLLEHDGSAALLASERGALYRRNLELLLDALDRHVGSTQEPLTGIDWNRPAGGFFVVLSLPRPVDAALLARSASEFGVLWTPMASFYLDGAGDDKLRLSCSYLQPSEIEEGVVRLARFLQAVVH